MQTGTSEGKYRALAYRAGLLIQVLGAGILAALYPIGHPMYTIGIMVFELGALVSGITLRVWITWIRKVILGAIVAGILVQILGLYFAPAEHALTVTFAGIGLICIGAAGMAGKEAYCFAFREGWILMWLYPFMVFMNLLGIMHQVLNAMAFSIHFLLLLSLAGKKFKQPLLSARTTTACDTPEIR